MYGHGGRHMGEGEGSGGSGFGPYRGGGGGERHGGFSQGGGGGRYPPGGRRGGGFKRPDEGRGGGGKRFQGDSAARDRLVLNGLLVNTNLFPLVMRGRVELNIHQFEIKIENARKKRVEANPVDDSGKDIPGGAADQVVAPPEHRIGREINDKSSPLSRRILLKCQQVVKDEWFFVTDGTKIAYSIHNIPEKHDVTKFKEGEEKDEAGIVVQVKDGCDDNDEDASHVVSKKYVVFFLPVGDPFRIIIQDGRVDPSCCENVPRFNNFLHLLLNNACMKAGLISTKQNPERYYFPLVASRNLLGRNFQERNSSHPFLALSQSVNMAVDGSMQIQSDFSLGWFESVLVKKPLLNPQARTLVGVPVDLNRPITDARTQKAVQDALKPLLFHARYERGPKWEANEKKFLQEKFQGKDDLETFIQDQIAKKRVAIQLNRRLVIPKIDEQACIKFAPNDFTFSFKERDMTVQEYFKERYDVDLMFPHMPLILIRKRDYMPSEFLYRAFDEQKNANHDSQKETALQLCDEHSGSRRISHIERLNRELPLEPTLRELLGKLQIEREPKCLQVKASVLKEPDVAAGDGMKSIFKGSWDCRRVNESGVLHTLAVIDLTVSTVNARNGQDITSLLQTCENQGIMCQVFRRDEIDQLTVSLPPRFPHGARVDLKLARKMAADVRRKAYQFFLRGGYNRPFKTTVRCMGELKECVIVPIDNNPVFYFKENRNTHEISGNPDVPDARYGAKLCFSRSPKAEGFLDPFEHFNEIARDFPRLHHFYYLENGFVVPTSEAEFSVTLPVHGLSIDPNHGMIDCPSIVIVRMRDKDAMQYSLMKYALYEAGLQSQCFVDGEKFRVLTRNLAIKINAKLANPIHQSNSWKVQGAASQWLKANQTLVIGYAFAGAQGRNGNMVVAASSCIDEEGLSMRHANIVLPKSPYLKPVAAEKLVSTLYDSYVKDRKQRPRHLVVFRCNGQDSELKEIGQQELDPIESIFREKSLCHYPEFPGLAVVSDPKVTFLVAQTLNKVKLAPDLEQQIRLEGNNVPSGTCVTDSRVISNIIDGSGVQVFEGGWNRDFILVPQHGLKGTSKPVYYRVLKLGIDGSQENIRDVTYSLSFRYATATKAPRLPAVILYSQRIAGVILACLPELQQGTDEGEGMFREANLQGYFSRDMNSGDHMVFTHVEGPTAFHPHLLA